jgi:plasmid stabilization system protein ParE
MLLPGGSPSGISPSFSAADAFAQRIDANFRNLERFPFIGRERSRLASGLRCLIVGLHLIFYTVHNDKITVVRVIDSRMDVEEEFHR